MTLIDLNATPADIFKAAALAAHRTSLVLEEARKRIAGEEAAYANANANLQWVAAHPSLADVDKAALYNEAIEGITLADLEAPKPEEPASTERFGDLATAPGPEPTGAVKQAASEESAAPTEEKPKRRRRTKAEMEAARAAEAAEKAAAEGALATAAAEAGQPATTDEVAGAGVPPEPVEQPAAPPASAFDPFGATGGAPAPAAPAAPPAMPANAFDPFGTGTGA